MSYCKSPASHLTQLFNGCFNNWWAAMDQWGTYEVISEWKSVVSDWTHFPLQLKKFCWFLFLIKLLYNEKRALKLFETDAQDVMAASIKVCNIFIQNPKIFITTVWPNLSCREHSSCWASRLPGFCFTSKWWCQHMSICIKCKHLKTHSSSPLCANPQHFSWRVWWECFMVIGYTQITAQRYTNIEPTHI